MSRLCSSLLLSLLIASSASAVTMAWTSIGNPGNPGDSPFNCSPPLYPPTDCGAVPYVYNIGTYDVTNAQYAEFLNAKAKSDPLGLYHEAMAHPSGLSTDPLLGGITRSGSDGSYTYTAIVGRESMPVNHVTVSDAMRFANWMNNGQGDGDTETGAYTLLGGTEMPSNATTVTRNAGATIVLPTENEWYKAAYYDAATASYFQYPAGSNAEPTCASPTAAPNSANCGGVVNDLTPVGSYTGSPSPYGTFDQGGNVTQWTETIRDPSGNPFRIARGSDWFDYRAGYAGDISYLGSSNGFQSDGLGFRLAMIPEPGQNLLLVAGVLGVFGLAGWRRVHTS